jgi:beta-fructofuranosidase
MSGVGGRTTRRGFLGGVAAVTAVAAAPRAVMGQESGVASALEARLAEDPERPQFHLLPARNWMNDPNGPIYFEGKYHMFFQYNPLAAVWGDMSWNHAMSPDMMHWQHMPVAMTPTPGSVDAFGVFSGSALKVGLDTEGRKRERVYAVYTGTQKSDDAHATIRDGANNIQESQCLAWSDDARLVKWTKDPQPIVAAPPAGMKITGFRDPSAWRQGDWYYMTVGSGVAGVGGCVLLYRSPAKGDLKQWEYMHPLTSGEWDGKKTANPCDDGEMWECPEFFALGNGHVLIYSTLGKVFWESGVLDEATMTFTMKKRGELDWGGFYAPKTQLDAKGRRILWGWIQEKRSDAAMMKAGWSGMMGLPRVMTLDADGTLRMEFLPELSGLRLPGVKPAAGAQGTTLTVEKACGEFMVKGARFEAVLRTSFGAELMRVTLADGEVHVDDKVLAVPAGEAVELHAYVDGSVVELMVNRRVGYTKRFYYDGATAPDVVMDVTHAPGTIAESRVWKIVPISANRLTTPA